MKKLTLLYLLMLVDAHTTYCAITSKDLALFISNLASYIFLNKAQEMEQITKNIAIIEGEDKRIQQDPRTTAHITLESKDFIFEYHHIGASTKNDEEISSSPTETPYSIRHKKSGATVTRQQAEELIQQKYRFKEYLESFFAH